MTEIYKLIKLNRLFVYFIYIAPVIFVATFTGDGVGDLLPIWTSIVVILISTYGIMARTEIPFSLAKIVSTFSFLFLGIVPIVTYKYSIDYWDAGPFASSDYLLANSVIICSLILFNLTYSFFHQKSKHSATLEKNELTESVYEGNIGLYLVAISSLICIYIYYLNGFDIFNVWTRGKLGDRTNVVEYGQIQYLFVSFLLTPMLSINLLLYGMARKKSQFIFFILTLLLILTAPPTAMPRFAAAAMYFPLILWYFKIFQKKYVFPMSLIFSVLLIFPLLEIFRYTLTNLSDISMLALFLSLFTGGHLDSYQSLMVILKDGTVTYGFQLIGALLFFLPRDLWPDKPIGSGQFMAEKLNYSFHNISANYLSEGYINFGYFGILLFVFVLAKFCGHFDAIWQTGRLIGPPRRIATYLIILPLLFFTLRGDLMSSCAFIFGFVFAIYILDAIISLSNKRSPFRSR